ncbi:YchJ family metal-binding protein [Flavobacterium sp. LS1R49]|uniref:YchJ family metal-binding protein n=1 Tax=Flavobacterium shii TaxID=2987687 RepID=A0A9X2YWR6_9FLAO|nr:YchJ family metal-binding protein [Flavobacterium shii]MCV9929449.1 YchJ family metal-binding protein [Flavobacterium shii]
MENSECYCDTGLDFDNCCGLYLKNKQKAPTALTLMRSRFSAYVIKDADYLMATTHPSERIYYSKEEILKWATANEWIRLEIINFTEVTVAFKAYFLDDNKLPQIHYEFSTFKQENGVWYYLEGKFE